jgi:PAS domain S-box-containing protein
MNVEKGQVPVFLQGGGEMGERIRQKDWSKSPLGTPDNWPNSLLTTVNILLNSQFPMFVWWGKELTAIYNDPYRAIAGEKHPELLGRPGLQAWAEISGHLAPLVKKVFQGTSTWSEDQLLLMDRHGYPEETYFTFSYSPIFDETGEVAGLFCACIETTEKVFAARRIKESEQNLRNTILQSPVAMCILKGPSFAVEIANSRMYELWGRGADALLNKSIFEGLPEVRQQGFEEILQQVFTTGEAFIANERPVVLPRGGIPETIFLNFVYEPFREGDGTISGVIAVAVDVTEQVLARKKIEESEQELQARVSERTNELLKQNHLVENILANSSNGISVSEMLRDERGNVIDAKTILANDAAVRNIGLPKEVYLAKTATEIDADIMQSAYGLSCIKTLTTGEPFVTQYYLDITGKWLELTVSKMDDDHLIHIFTDITSIKQSQLQLERTIEELKRSNSNLEQFAYAASHDLKEPVRKINIFSDRLRNELEHMLTETQSKLFERMVNAAKRMTILIDDLLEYSHATKGIINVESIDLNQKLEMVLEDLDIQVQEKHGKITADKLPVIKGNRRQIQQLFQNLLSNALKYSKPDRHPQITISSKRVPGRETPLTLSGEEGNQLYHLIQIKDNGIGFDPKYADDIFNIFTRLHGAAEYKGSGVGLSIVRRVIENHRGYIWAESTPGAGSTFSILLPVD